MPRRLIKKYAFSRLFKKSSIFNRLIKYFNQIEIKTSLNIKLIYKVFNIYKTKHVYVKFLFKKKLFKIPNFKNANIT